MDSSLTLEAPALAKVKGACDFVNAEMQRLRHQLVAIGVACVVGAMLLWIVTGLGDPRVPLVLAGGSFAMCFARARHELAAIYGRVARKRIVAGLGKSLNYSATSSLTRRHFDALDLFTQPCMHWRASDEITGRANGVKYSLHRARAAADRRTAFFDGVIIKIDFAEPFSAHTVVLPDRTGQAVASKSFAGGRKKDLVMVKNPVFEQAFSVYSTDYYEARKQLTQAVMQTVLEAEAALATELRLCFLQKSLFVSVMDDSRRFEPTLSAPPLTPELALGSLVALVTLAERLATR